MLATLVNASANAVQVSRLSCSSSRQSSHHG